MGFTLTELLFPVENLLLLSINPALSTGVWSTKTQDAKNATKHIHWTEISVNCPNVRNHLRGTVWFARDCMWLLKGFAKRLIGIVLGIMTKENVEDAETLRIL